MAMLSDSIRQRAENTLVNGKQNLRAQIEAEVDAYLRTKKITQVPRGVTGYIHKGNLRDIERGKYRRKLECEMTQTGGE